MHWMVYAFVVIFGAAGMHIFSRLGKGEVDPVIGTLIAGFVMVCVVGVAFFFSDARMHLGEVSTKGVVASALMGCSVAAASLALFYVYNAGTPLSLAVPFIRVSGIILGVLVGLLFFAEKLSLMQALGLVLSLAGVVVMAL